MILGAMMLLSVCATLFTSCDKEDDPVAGKMEINISEIGEENSKTVVAGTDLHLEGTLFAENLIKTIKVTLKAKNGTDKVEADYSTEPYVNVKNANFHKHLDVPETFKAGEYELIFSVADAKGQTKEARYTVTVTQKDPDAPQVVVTAPGEGAVLKIGDEVTVEAKIVVKSAVKEIELEFHGSKGEYPIEVDDYNGKTGELTFKKTVVVPVKAEAGEYHLHLTVTDKDGRSTTSEVEGLKLTK